MVDEARVRVVLEVDEAKRKIREVRKEQDRSKEAGRLQKLAQGKGLGLGSQIRARWDEEDAEDKQSVLRAWMRDPARQTKALAGSLLGKAAVFAARGFAVDRTLVEGLPILSELLKTGIGEVAGTGPVSEGVKTAITQGMDKLTDLVQRGKAEVAGTFRTLSEVKDLAKGIALTGQDPSKLLSMDFLKALREVNVFESKLEQDITEAQLRQSTANFGEFIKQRTSEAIGDLFLKGSNR